MGMDGYNYAPVALMSVKEIHCPLYRRLGGAPGPVGTGADISRPSNPLQGFNPRTVQPVASCYTN